MHVGNVKIGNFYILDYSTYFNYKGNLLHEAKRNSRPLVAVEGNSKENSKLFYFLFHLNSENQVDFSQ